MAFRGFPDEATTFYEGLAADNSRVYWQANREVYERAVRSPMLALLDELANYGPFHVFRPYRDVRFAKDKTPYKDHVAAFAESEGGAGHYVQFGADGMLAGSGYYHMAADQMSRFRESVDDAALGADLQQRCDVAVGAGLRLGAIDTLKTAPRGYPKDHPRIDLLRRKGLITAREWTPAAWMRTNAAVRKVGDAWKAGAAINEWLDAHVGPSILPPDDRRR